jgi:hypothetical protein
MYQVDVAAKVKTAHGYKATAEALLKQGTAEAQESRQPKEGTALPGVEGPKLDGELMPPRVTVTNEVASLSIEVLLSVVDVLAGSLLKSKKI